MSRESSGAIKVGWVPYGNGYEVTESEKLIRNRLREVKQRRLPIAIVHEKYQSGNCILVEVSDTVLLLDKPRDWPGTQAKIRVIYRDPQGLWSHFYCQVTRTTDDTLHATMPTQFFLLQRREHYRVAVPAGSTVSFLCKTRLCTEFLLRDLSAGGALISHRQNIPLPPGAQITDLLLTLPSETAGEPTTTISCAGATVVRAFPNPQEKQFCYGLKFAAGKQEEDQLIRYVRQRELELLRKASG
ncbi:MAG: PilZ domain-containing protein [Thermodesulfobacteriota bacterium]